MLLVNLEYHKRCLVPHLKNNTLKRIAVAHRSYSVVQYLLIFVFVKPDISFSFTKPLLPINDYIE